MNIVCPNCGTSYDVEASALGPAGRTVRCARCRETWHARVDDMARADALVEAADEIGWDQALGHAPAATPAYDAETFEHAVPRIESPPLAHDGPVAQAWTVAAQQDASAPSRLAPGRRGGLRQFAFGSGPAKSVRFSPSIVIAAMAALVLALMFWRNDVVRLLPQTAAFFQFTGLGVNLRNLAFEDVRISTEMVNGNRVFVIEGAITPTARKPVEIPRLRFVVQDAHGADIYAWNSVVDQAVVKPGEKVVFKSRLASPPADAHSVVVRFFNRRDLASGSV
jgi:predicted Zn finger-like uncharacterized protein